MNLNYNSLFNGKGAVSVKSRGSSRGKPTESPVWRSWLTCCLMALSFILGQSAIAQSIQIGSGTGTSNGTSTIPVSNYNYNYSQQIVTAAEITAGGGSAGQLTKLRYKPTNAGTTTVWDNWTVWVGNTSKTAFASTTDWVPLSSMPQVFSGTISPVSNQWFEITFTAPFEYTGGNLVIAVDENSANYSTAPTFQSYTSTAASGIHY